MIAGKGPYDDVLVERSGWLNGKLQNMLNTINVYKMIVWRPIIRPSTYSREITWTHHIPEKCNHVPVCRLGLIELWLQQFTYLLSRVHDDSISSFTIQGLHVGRQ